MEFAASALTSIAGSGTAAGAIPGAIGATSVGGAPLVAGSGMLGSLGSASSAFSILSGGATVLSVLNASRAGDAKAMALNAQADDADAQARIAQLQGIDRGTSLKAALSQRLGSRDVATAASGTDLSFGTAAVSRQQDITDSERALSIDQDTTTGQMARLSERAANYRIQAKQASSAGLMTAATSALEGAAKLFKRG